MRSRKLAWVAMFMTLVPGFSGAGFAQDPHPVVQRLIQACQGNDPDLCEAEIGALNAAHTPDLLQDACQDQDGLTACTALGFLYETGLLVALDYAKARALYEQACEDENMAACLSLGNLYFEGFGVVQNFATGLEYSQHACDGGELNACIYLGTMYGNGYRLPRDPQQAQDLFGKACDEGPKDAIGCVHLATYLFRHHLRPEDKARALEISEQSCSAGNAYGCVVSADAYVLGRVGPSDPAIAERLFVKACEGGATEGCVSFGGRVNGRAGWLSKEPGAGIGIVPQGLRGRG